MVRGISSGLMLSLYKYGNSKSVDTNEVFASISVTVGGDGKTIKKSQLEKFVKDIDNGVAGKNLSKKQINAFKQLNSAWDTVFKGKDEITSTDFETTIGLFKDIIVNDTDGAEVKFLDELQEKLKEKHEKYLDELAEKINGDKDKKPTVTQLKDYLNELIEKNKDGENDEEIAQVTNLIAEAQNPVQNEYEV